MSMTYSEFRGLVAEMRRRQRQFLADAGDPSRLSDLIREGREVERRVDRELEVDIRPDGSGGAEATPTPAQATTFRFELTRVHGGTTFWVDRRDECGRLVAAESFASEEAARRHMGSLLGSS